MLEVFQPRPYEVVSSDVAVKEAIARLRDPIPCAEDVPPAVGMDFETGGLDSRTSALCLVQLANVEYTALLPFKELTEHGKGLVLDYMADDESRPDLLVYNAAFEWSFAKANGAHIKDGLIDLMLMAECVIAGMDCDHGLDAMVERYLKCTLPKNQQRAFWIGPSSGYSRHMWDYGACDCQVETDFYVVLHRLIERIGLREIVDVNVACAIPYAQMTWNGMGLNREGMQELLKDKEAEAAVLRPQVYLAMHEYRVGNGLPGYDAGQQSLLLDLPSALPLGTLNPGFSLDSPTELGRELVAIGVPLEETDDSQRKPGKTKTYKTNKDDLKPHADRFPFITELQKYQVVNTEAQDAAKYLKHWHPKTGRIHPGFNINYCETGRSSSSSPNCQNMPRSKAFRGKIIPAPGFRLLIADYSQIELRVMTQLTKDPVMLDAYSNTDPVLGDLHRRTAAVLNNKDPHDVTSDERSAAKNIIFGIMYGMQAASLQRYCFLKYDLRISIEEAEVFYDRFMEQYVGVKAFHEDIEKQISAGALREIWSIGGHRRTIPPDKLTLSRVANAYVQSCAATIMKAAASDIQPIFEEMGYPDTKLVNIVHDEAVCEARESEAADCLKILMDVMELAEARYLKDVPAKAEGKIATSWAEK